MPNKHQAPSNHSASSNHSGFGGSADSRNPQWDSYVPEGHGRTDEQIRADVQQKITAESGSIGDNSRALSITVADGVVTLEGEVANGAIKQHLSDIIQAVPSVREVANRLRLASDREGSH